MQEEDDHKEHGGEEVVVVGRGYGRRRWAVWGGSGEHEEGVG